MFKHMEISDNIYEVIVEPPYKKYTRVEFTHAGHRKTSRVGSDLSINNPDMGYRSGKRKKSYVENPSGAPPLTCLNHSIRNSLDQCKVRSNFGKN